MRKRKWWGMSDLLFAMWFGGERSAVYMEPLETAGAVARDMLSAFRVWVDADTPSTVTGYLYW